MCSDVAQPQDGPNSSPDSPFWAGGESEFFSSKPQIFGRSHQKRPKVVKNSSNGLMTKCPKNGHVFPSAATVMQHVVMHNCCAAAQSHVSLSFRHFFSAMPQTSLCLLILIGAPQRPMFAFSSEIVTQEIVSHLAGPTRADPAFRGISWTYFFSQPGETWLHQKESFLKMGVKNCRNGVFWGVGMRICQINPYGLFLRLSGAMKQKADGVSILGICGCRLWDNYKFL